MKAKVALFLILLLFITQPCFAAGVYGTVINKQGQVMPGITVSLVHEKMGRSSSSITDGSGRYKISALPNNNKFYIEAHWGKELIYRQAIVVSGNMKTNIKIR